MSAELFEEYYSSKIDDREVSQEETEQEKEQTEQEKEQTQPETEEIYTHNAKVLSIKSEIN